MPEFEKLFTTVFLHNPLQGFFIALSILFFGLMTFVFLTCPRGYAMRTEGDLHAPNHHCHIRRRLFKWRSKK